MCITICVSFSARRTSLSTSTKSFQTWRAWKSPQQARTAPGLFTFRIAFRTLLSCLEVSHTHTQELEHTDCLNQFKSDFSFFHTTQVCPIFVALIKWISGELVPQFDCQFFFWSKLRWIFCDRFVQFECSDFARRFSTFCVFAAPSFHHHPAGQFTFLRCSICLTNFGSFLITKS